MRRSIEGNGVRVGGGYPASIGGFDNPKASFPQRSGLVLWTVVLRAVCKQISAPNYPDL